MKNRLHKMLYNAGYINENNNEIIQAGIKHLNNQINDFILAGVIASLMGNLYIGFLMEFSYGDDNVYRCCYDSKGIDFYR